MSLLKSRKWTLGPFLFEIIYIFFAYLVTILGSMRLVKSVPEVLSAPKVPLWQMLLSFGVGTVVLLLALKFLKRGIFFHLLFSFGLFLGIELILSLILPFLFSLISAVGLIACRYLYPKVWVQNLVLILGLSGLAVSLGLNISWVTAIILLALLSLYDIIAVYKTRHMTRMAEGLIQRRIFPALIIPSQISSFNTALKTIEPGEGFIFLGSGDIVFPLLLAVSALPLGLGKMLAAAGGGFLGIILSLVIFNLQRKRRPLPALPPIALLSILGFGIGYFVF